MTRVLPAGRHGGDGARVAAALGLDPASVLDLSASMNPVAPDIRPLLAARLDAVRRYPDPAAATTAMAQALGVDAERVLLTNGGAEAIALVTADMGGHVREPEFALYPRGVGGPRWRSDPHNPTGRLAGSRDGHTDEAGIVWDEAFYALATGRWTRPGRAVVVGSLTKLFACPGLRIGYLLAEPDMVDRLRRRQPQWSVNALAAAVLPYLLETADPSGWAKAIAPLRQDLTTLLAAFDLDPQPSDANYVLCATAPGLRERLAPHGVVVRDCSSFGLPGHSRVAVPDERGLQCLEDALCAAG